jgi:DNA-binding PadR family transcriptional regulator
MGRTAATHDRRCTAVDAPILNALSSGPMHGYAISESIGHFSEGLLALEERELHAASHRLEFHGVLTAEWRIGGDRQPAKYYRLPSVRASRPELMGDSSRVSPRLV